MRLTRSTIFPLLLICLAGALSCRWFLALWREAALFAIALSALLLLGAGFLPSRPEWLRAILIGMCAGAFIGGCLAAGGFCTHSANQPFQPTPTARAELKR